MRPQNVNSLIAELNSCIQNNEPTRLFLKAVDETSFQLFSDLSSQGATDAVAKLATTKILNIIVAKYEYLNRQNHVLSHPFGLSVEPSNACNLYCPGCIREDHANNYTEGVSWHGGLTKLSRYREFVDYYGPSGIVIQFHNWGEPLINPNLPDMVNIAKRFMLYTFLSTNLSVKFDADEVVRSGLDYMELAIDGATPESYMRYRKGGDLALVLENIKRLDAAKKRHGSITPILSWRFLTFEHNLSEIDQAIELARECGVNRFHVATPYPNSGASVVPVRSPREGAIPLDIKWARIREDQNQKIRAIPGDDVLERAFTRRFYDEFKQAPIELTEKRPGATCKWLYMNMFVDAHSRILPCCTKPIPSLIYGKFDTTEAGAFNSDKYVDSRAWFAKGRPELPEQDNKVTACMRCPDPNSEPNMNLDMVKRLFGTFDIYESLSVDSIELLTSW